MKRKELYRQLVERYLNRTASMDELQVFFHLLEKGKLKKHLILATQNDWEPSTGRLRLIARRYSMAAALLGVLGLGIFLLWKARPRNEAVPAFVSVYKNDIEPGADRAVLALADGSRVRLDRLEDYSRLGDGRNTGRTKGSHRGPLYNSLSTPAAGQYRLTLPDGTKVWLNAQSSIRFPTSFYGNTRSVELSGEAYFQVAKDARRPFLVKAGDLTIQALGTQFNVHAYLDESSAKATLILGAVRVVKGEDSLLLAPGQEGETNKTTGLMLNSDVDTSQIAAWKDGYFDFDHLDIQAIMRQFARWYDIQVVYEGKPSTVLFEGRMQRNLRLSQVMNGLGKTGIHSRLEGRVLTILP